MLNCIAVKNWQAVDLHWNPFRLTFGAFRGFWTERIRFIYSDIDKPFNQDMKILALLVVCCCVLHISTSPLGADRHRLLVADNEDHGESDTGSELVNDVDAFLPAGFSREGRRSDGEEGFSWGLRRSNDEHLLLKCVFCTRNAHICDPLRACYPTYQQP